MPGSRKTAGEAGIDTRMLNTIARYARQGLNLVRRSLENPSTPFSSWFRPNSLAGVSIDEDSCLEHLPIYSAVNGISSDMALVDPELKQLQSDGSWKVAADDPLHYLITTSPDGEIDSDRWRQTSMGHVLTSGNAYSEIEFDEMWQPCGFHLLSPRRMRVWRKPDGELVYTYNSEFDGTHDLPPWKVLHFAGLGFDGVVGYSPIAMARETLGLGKAADLYGAAFFGNSARPSGVLSVTGKMSEPAKATLREQFTAATSGVSNVGRTIIGEDGMKWESMTIPPDEAQFLQTRQMSVQDVARLYKYPVHKLQDMSGATFSNIEEQNIDYLQSTLLGHCKMFANQIRLKCLSGPGRRGRYKVDHDFKSMLKANAAARAQYYATGIQWGWLTRNAVAREEGYPTFPGGDEPLLPLNMVMLGPDGRPMVNDEVAQMVRSFLADKQPPAIAPAAAAPPARRHRRR